MTDRDSQSGGDRTRVSKFTLRLSEEAATILRGVAADWGLSQHDALELLAKWFVATGGHRQQRIDFEGAPAARIAVAMAEWRRRADGAGSRGGGGGLQVERGLSSAGAPPTTESN
jgi:hypothetical protein